jgi:predicted TIM-barrel fold metal-dependent hydrolase
MEPSASPEDLPTIERAEPRQSWLALHNEAVIEPDLAIIDPHHHVSDAHWGGYLADDLLQDLNSGHRIQSTVYIQCGYGYRSEGPVHLRPVGETEKVVALARAVEQRGVSTRVCEGIVAYADLTLGEAVDEVLEAHAQTGAGRLRGIRCGAARHKDFRYGMLVPPPLHLYADSAFRRGFARLARHGLSFESWAFHTQMDELLALAKDHPDTLIVINHVGTPVGVGPYAGRLDEAFVEWASALGPLAALPNTCLKIGGFGMTIFGFDFHLRPRPPSSVDLAQAWRPYVEKCLELFGADRCMFESNFPVDKGTCSYAVLWNAFKRLASGASADEKMQLFRGTAARVYRLKP